MDLPVDDNAATLSDYADVVVEAIGDLREDLVVRRRWLDWEAIHLAA